MLRIVMDSAGDVPAGWAEKFGIDIIPINIHFDEHTYLQGVDISNRDFYRMADESGDIMAIGKSKCNAASLKEAKMGDFFAYVRVLI